MADASVREVTAADSAAVSNSIYTSFFTTRFARRSLETLAELGLTIAMVIHQPRIELLNKIQNLVLLQRGGWPVYVGPTKEALPYIEDYLGLQLPSQTSPADFFLDVITLDQKVEDNGEKVLKVRTA